MHTISYNTDNVPTKKKLINQDLGYNSVYIILKNKNGMDILSYQSGVKNQIESKCGKTPD
ncbi:hypothetical protein DERF_002907 [Dermatophagoides farinae]|uniref:Uncharacterized protein n=1 Tax=Dermatophagoides farinae TaxID=6954 RepID=A0A922LAZ2_DERFA|nr:hypothetical protein DERF_002907 [Dermatophagoides farinae]